MDFYLAHRALETGIAAQLWSQTGTRGLNPFREIFCGGVLFAECIAIEARLDAAMS